MEQCFRAIIEGRLTSRIARMVKRCNDIYRVQMPDITPHVCRHICCGNQAKAV